GLGLLAVLVGGTAVAVGHAIGRHRQAAVALEEGNVQMRHRAFFAARGAYQRGLTAVEDLPLAGRVRRDLDEGLRRAGRAEAAGELHRAAEQLRGLYGSEALSVLEEAEQTLGPSVVLAHEVAQHAGQLGLAEKASEAARRARGMEPRSAWEHYALGCAALRAGEPGRARHHLEQALEREPR